jgi:uncharacterized membrane protein YphA (DoxX/SURF4 family)
MALLAHRALSRPARAANILPLAATFGAFGTSCASAHEAWLLTPASIADLSSAPVPHLFSDPLRLGAASLIAFLIARMALWAEDRFGHLEARFAAPLARQSVHLGPLLIRLALATMLALSAMGLLPRHGTALGVEPTLLVPDMQVSLAPGWEALAPIQMGLAGVLALGLLARLAGLAVVCLSLSGLAAFGAPFLSYAPHFAAPGLMLAICGGGAMSLDRSLDCDDWLRPAPRAAALGWRVALAMTGACFVYLAVAFKLGHPALLMAILEHGHVPLMGLPLDMATLVMALVEIVAGTLLAFGRLTRPLGLVLIAAFTFLAVTLGETPLFHLNLYAVMFMLVLSGRGVPTPLPRLRTDQDLPMAAQS